MPLPIIPIIAIAVSGVAVTFGAYKGGKSIHRNIKASDINKEAKMLLDLAQAHAVIASNKSEKSLNTLGEMKLEVLDKSASRFIAVFEKIHNIELTDSAGLDELAKYRIDKQSVLELRKISDLAVETLKGLVGGAGAGALAAFGAYGATMTFASASTGTAIAALSGIAAKNATLAFLGGGALAAGGGGMALGTIVLGGLVVGPAMAILGVVMDAGAIKAVEKALGNKAKAKVMAAELKVVKSLCDGIAKRADMFSNLLESLNQIFVTLTSQLEFIVATKGNDYAEYSEAEQNRVAMAMSIAGAIKKVLDTPILCEDGGITEESEQTHDEISQYLEKAKEKVS
jgi:hypothetical protein